FMISAAKGVDKGIKILSNINIVVAGLLFLFILAVGPTLFIMENFVTTLGGYIANLIPMRLTLTPFSESEWLGKNTIFFWAGLIYRSYISRKNDSRVYGWSAHRAICARYSLVYNFRWDGITH